jgi:hypothetical protein
MYIDKGYNISVDNTHGLWNRLVPMSEKSHKWPMGFLEWALN